MSEKAWVPFNGKSSSLSRILEALIIAGVVAGIGLWGNSKVIDLKLEHICESITKLENVAGKLEGVTTSLQTRDATQEIRITILENRINRKEGIK